MKQVYGNGPIFVGDAARSWARWIGVVDGRVHAVGSEQHVRTAVGADADYVDLNGRMLVPGFHDAHVHPVDGGMRELTCDLDQADDAEAALAIVADYTESNRSAHWIVGAGWHYSWFEGGNPPATLLDRVTDRPAYFVVGDGHSGWANSAALRLAGIDADTPDPIDGRIERLDDGSPQGTLHEGAMRLMDAVTPGPGPETVLEALEAGQRTLLSYGITAWQDAWVTADIHDAYRTLARRDGLRAHVRGALWWDRHRDLDQLEEIVATAAEGVGRYVPRTVKLMLDGVCENHTAAMLHPYLDRSGQPTENRGMDFIDPARLAEIVAAIDQAELQVHFHALGDRAVRHALDAVEYARRANGWSDHRPHVAHLQVVDPADIPRFRELSVTANIQPLWAVADEAMLDLTIPHLPSDRVGLQYPFGSLLASGATMAMGSDWPVSTPDVLDQIGVAVGRNDPSIGVDEPFLPDQRIGFVDGLAAVTAGSAYVNHLDASTGSLVPGKRADLVILDADPLAVPSIGSVEVMRTVIGGEVVYDSEDAA